jgi:hypothetical protein
MRIAEEQADAVSLRDCFAALGTRSSSSIEKTGVTLFIQAPARDLR